MATQSLKVSYRTGKTLTAKAFARDSDTVVQTASAVTEATNRKSWYFATFTDLPAADYDVIYFLDGTAARDETYTLTLTTGTFYPWSERKPAEAADVAITVTPLTGTVDARSDGTAIRVFTEETLTVSIAVVDAAGDDVDVDALTLAIVIEKRNGSDSQTIADGSITKSGSTISFAVPEALSATEGEYRWSLRNTADNSVLLQGPFTVQYAPQVDS